MFVKRDSDSFVRCYLFGRLWIVTDDRGRITAVAVQAFDDGYITSRVGDPDFTICTRWDGDLPSVGDCILSQGRAGAQSVYRVVGVCLRTKDGAKVRIPVCKVDRPAPGARVHPWSWKAAEKGKRAMVMR